MTSKYLMTKKTRPALLFVPVVVATVTGLFPALIGCSKLRSAQTGLNVPGSFFVPGDGSLIPSSDKLSSDCATNSAFDACIFLKNPVAQESGLISLPSIENARRFGVKMRGLYMTGYLENQHFQVLTLNSPRLSLMNLNLLKSPFSDQGSYLEQVNAYYWANRSMEYLSQRLGGSRVPLSPLKIYVDDAFTGYVSTRNAIHLEKTAGKIPKALSAEVLLQLIGQALAQDLSRRALYPGALAQHKNCGLSPRGCCATENGCSQALGSAFGDYLAAVMFPTSPRLGETISSSTSGQTLCGFTRDLGVLSVRTKAEIFSACSSSGAEGQVTLMGAWYASLWWKLRQQLESDTAGAGADIDALFFEHARAWTSQTTFAEAKAAALAAGARVREGIYTQGISAALSGL